MCERNLDQSFIFQLNEFMDANWDHFSQLHNPYEDHSTELFHYTKITTLFDILEGDSLWLSGLRFSNDASEEKVLGEDWLKKHCYNGDNFVLCLGSEGDLLSQWRGYCPSGGAAIGLNMTEPHKYSVLCSDYESSRRHIDIVGTAIPVLYLFANQASHAYIDPRLKIHYAGRDVQLIARELMEKIANILRKNGYSLLREAEFVPYIKHNAFYEERERRIIISNTYGDLSKCIRFRKLTNGTKIPYIVVKYGCIDESHEHIHPISDDRLKSLIGYLGNTSSPIILPVCANQSELYLAVKQYIEENSPKDKLQKSTIVCDGHLPIRSIRIAPMHDQSRIKEQVERFCKSRYWLRDVKISTSEIPYVPSINS